MQVGVTYLARFKPWFAGQKSIRGTFTATISHISPKGGVLLNTKEHGEMWAPQSQVLLLDTFDNRNIKACPINVVGLLNPPWPHQLEAYDFISDKAGALLAMDMGTGKTLVIVSEWVTRQPLITVIVAPNSAVLVWPNEFMKHCAIPFHMLALTADQSPFPRTTKLANGSTVTTAGGTIANRAQVAKDFIEVMGRAGIPCILVLNYEAAHVYPFGPDRDEKNNVIKSREGLLGTCGIGYLVADEAHRLKALRGKWSKFFQWIGPRVDIRRALTGTPASNGPLEVYGIMRYVAPTVFQPSFSEFQTNYALIDKFKRPYKYLNMDDYGERLGSITFRVMAKDVLTLPGALHTYRYFFLGERAARLYDSIVDKLFFDDDLPQVSPDNALVEIVRLQQITSGYVLDDDTEYHRVDTGKADALRDVLEDLAPEGKLPIIVFAKFTTELDIIKEVVLKLKLTYGEISGRFKGAKSALDGNHLRDGIQVVGVQIDAGGAGIDLTAAKTTIYWSTGYSLVNYDQSLRRNHRPGQTDDVTYIHLVADGTVDIDVIEALSTKQNVVLWALSKMKNRRKKLAA